MPDPDVVWTRRRVSGDASSVRAATLWYSKGEGRDLRHDLRLRSARNGPSREGSAGILREDILRVCFISRPGPDTALKNSQVVDREGFPRCGVSRGPYQSYTGQTSCRHEQARRKIGPLLCWQTGLGVELHRDRTLPSTDSRAMNGLIFWFEGYHFSQGGRRRGHVDAGASVPVSLPSPAASGGPPRHPRRVLV